MRAIPISSHKLAGTFRKSRHRAMALHPIKAPPAPKWLSAPAKKKWKEVARLLCETGVLTSLDLDALAAYVTAWATWRQATDELQKKGMTYKSKSLVKINPLVAVAQACARELQTWGDKLALTPSSRQRLRVEVPVELSDADKHKARFFTREPSASSRDRSKDYENPPDAARFFEQLENEQEEVG